MCKQIVVFVVMLIAVLPQLFIIFKDTQFERRCGYSFEVLTPDQLANGIGRAELQRKNVLVIGGTRGIGLGTTLAVAKAGVGYLAVVGRNKSLGESIGNLVKSVYPYHNTKFNMEYKFYQADLSTVKGALKFISELKSSGIKFDHVVVTAGVWPDYKNPKTSDGIEKVFAIDVLGRYIVFRHAHEFLNPAGARVINVLASGMVPQIDKITSEEISGQFVFQDTKSWMDNRHSVLALGDMMLIYFSEKWSEEKRNVKVFGSEPGVIPTELFNDQSFMESLINNPIFSYIASLKTVEQVGREMASVLVTQGVKDPLTFVDERLGCRVVGEKIRRLYKNHGKQMVDTLEKIINDKK